jgi:hypothetical protein
MCDLQGFKLMCCGRKGTFRAEVPGKAIYRIHVSGLTSSETCAVSTLSGLQFFSVTRTTLSVQLFHLRFGEESCIKHYSLRSNFGAGVSNGLL